MFNEYMGKAIHKLSQINKKDKTAICSYCGLTKIKIPPTRSPICRESINMRRRGIEGYSAPIRGSHCEICGKECATNWDHCHITGKFRGWLCRGCNMGLGAFRDNTDSLKNAIAYLQKQDS